VVGARSVTRFDGVAARLVQELKYGGWTRIAPVLARPMARIVQRVHGTDPVLVPVPTTSRRLRARGFNAPELLAEEVGKILEMPVERALSRPREAPRQVGLSPSQRAANVRGAFIVGPASNAGLRHHHVFLVDDVLTTGSTGVAAAEALAAAGVRSVTLLTFARALPGLPGA
jgi:ComF family protein